jgi:hypothetical protein
MSSTLQTINTTTAQVASEKEKTVKVNSNKNAPPSALPSAKKTEKVNANSQVPVAPVVSAPAPAPVNVKVQAPVKKLQPVTSADLARLRDEKKLSAIQGELKEAKELLRGEVTAADAMRKQITDLAGKITALMAANGELKKEVSVLTAENDQLKKASTLKPTVSKPAPVVQSKASKPPAAKANVESKEPASVPVVRSNAKPEGDWGKGKPTITDGPEPEMEERVDPPVSNHKGKQKYKKFDTKSSAPEHTSDSKPAANQEEPQKEDHEEHSEPFGLVCNFHGDSTCRSGVETLYNPYGGKLILHPRPKGNGKYQAMINGVRTSIDIYGSFCGFRDHDGVFRSREHRNWNINDDETLQSEHAKFIKRNLGVRCPFEVASEKHQTTLNGVVAECLKPGCLYKHRASRPKIDPLLGFRSMAIDDDSGDYIRWPKQFQNSSSSNRSKPACHFGERCAKRFVAQAMVSVTIECDGKNYTFRVPEEEFRYSHESKNCYYSQCGRSECDRNHFNPYLDSNCRPSGKNTTGRLGEGSPWHVIGVNNPNINEAFDEQAPLLATKSRESGDGDEIVDIKKMMMIWDNQASMLASIGYKFKEESYPVLKKYLREEAELLMSQSAAETSVEAETKVEDETTVSPSSAESKVEGEIDFTTVTPEKKLRMKLNFASDAPVVTKKTAQTQENVFGVLDEKEPESDSELEIDVSQLHLEDDADEGDNASETDEVVADDVPETAADDVPETAADDVPEAAAESTE